MFHLKNDEEKKLGFGITSDGEQTIIKSYQDTGAEELIIPDLLNGAPVRVIAFGAFSSCQSIRSIQLPDTVTHIESNAFRGCINLEKVVVGENLQNIGAYAFAGCKSLNSLRIPSNVRNININAFKDCTNFYNLWIYDNARQEHRHFVLACENPHRFWGFLQAAITYFDTYSMKKYDEGFSIVQEVDDIFRISVYRLADPLQLSDNMRQVYELNVRSAILRLIEADDVASLTQAGEVNCIEDHKLDFYIEMANRKAGNCIAYLLEYKKDHGKMTYKEKDFSL